MLYNDIIGIAGQLYCMLGVVGRTCKELKGRIQRLYLLHTLDALEFQQEASIYLGLAMLVSVRM